jgi:endogenous inhibitor of DNA gyrase (YacG/DUF329 family)
MIQGRCPICGKSHTIQALDDLPTFPFCSDRCRLIDLGRWIDGAYTIPGPEAPPDQPGMGGQGEETAEDG